MSARNTPAQHTVRIKLTLNEHETGWRWVRESANNVQVARSARVWDEHRHAVRAARSEARLTGARLVIDGEEVNV